MKEREICVETYKAEQILTMSFDFEEDDVAEIFAKAKTVWSIEDPLGDWRLYFCGKGLSERFFPV